MNGTVWGVLHDLERGEADECVKMCNAAGCTNGLVYTVHEFCLRSENCPKCKGTGWGYK